MQSDVNGVLIFGSPRCGTTVLASAIHMGMQDASPHGQSMTFVDEIFNHFRIYDRDWTWQDWSEFNLYPTMVDVKTAMTKSRVRRMLQQIDDASIWPIIKIHAQELLHDGTSDDAMALLNHPRLFKIIMMRRDVDNMLASMLLKDFTFVSHIFGAADREHYDRLIEWHMQNQTEVSWDKITFGLRELFVHTQFLTMSYDMFDQIIWYDQLLDGTLSIPGLGISTDDMTRMLGNPELPKKVNANAADVLRRCITNPDVFDNGVGIAERMTGWIMDRYDSRKNKEF